MQMHGHTISRPSLINLSKQLQDILLESLIITEEHVAGTCTVSVWGHNGIAASQWTVIWLRHLLSWCSAPHSIVSGWIPRHCDFLSQTPQANKAGRQGPQAQSREWHSLSGHAKRESNRQMYSMLCEINKYVYICINAKTHNKYDHIILYIYIYYLELLYNNATNL